MKWTGIKAGYTAIPAVCGWAGQIETDKPRKMDKWRKLFHCILQLNPALTNFRGPAISFCYIQTFVIANKGNKIN